MTLITWLILLVDADKNPLGNRFYLKEFVLRRYFLFLDYEEFDLLY